MSQNQEDREPTRDEVIAWYKDQIQLAKLRHELAELQSKAVQEEVKRLQATMIIAQLTQEPQTQNTSQKNQTPEV